MTPDQEPTITRWTAAFADAVRERVFRVDAFPAFRRQNRLVAAILAVLVLAHAWLDWTITGGGEAFWTFLAVRVAVAAMVMQIFLTSVTARRFELADMGVFMALVSIAAGYVYLSSAQEMLLPKGQQSAVSIRAMVILIGFYLLLRTTPILHLIAGAGMSIGYITVGLASGRLAPDIAALEAVVHIAINVLGTYWVLRSQTTQRRQFLAARALERANRQLARQGEALRQAADELREARDDAIRANRAKSRFLASVSHELRAPLNAIIGFSEVMTAQIFGRMSPPRYLEYAEDIHASGTHLLAVINDLLDLSKAEAGRLDLDETEVAVDDVAAEVCRLAAGRAETKQIAVRNRLPAGLPLLCADRRLVKQMMLNLLTNAVKYTPAGGKVAVGAEIADNGALQIWVSDTGVGMAPEDIPRLLSPYERATGTADGSEEGTGLGLTLVRVCLKLHGGKLEVESAVGEGSRFTLVFPPDRVVPIAETPPPGRMPEPVAVA